MSSPADYYYGLPPITRAFATACFATTLGVQFGLVNPRSIFLNWMLVGKQFHLCDGPKAQSSSAYRQIWRLFTNFIFLGGFSFAFVMRMLYILRYGVQLERSAFEGRPADFAWMMIFCMGVILGLQLLLPFMQTPFGSVPLVFALVYLWGREFPTASVSIFGLFQVKAFYLPWTLMAIDLLMGQPIIEDVMGILAAHLYYFLAVLYPRTGGENFMRTPELVRSLVHSAFGGVAGPGGRVQQTAPRAFQGRGRRLVD